MGKDDELRRKIEALKHGWSRNPGRLDRPPGRLEARSALDALRRSVTAGGVRVPPPETDRGNETREPGDAAHPPTPQPAETDSTRRLIYRRDLPAARTPPSPARGTPTRHVALAEAVRAENVSVPDCGEAVVVPTRLEELDEQCAALACRLRDALLDASSPVSHRFARVGDASPARIEDLLFVDLETTGLSSTPVFLVGVMAWEDGDLVVRQFFARTYAEERAILSLFVECARNRRAVVSFNGKSFDIPYLRARCAAMGVDFACPHAHLDLLHESRRAWKHTLPDCRLQTLEEHVCGRRRHGDIPGWAIPDAYHEYVRTANAVEMVEVLKHNLLDLVTLADLLLRLPADA